MNKKIIGIPGWILGTSGFGVKTPYIEYVSRFGIPLILTPQMNEVMPIDLLFLPGGADVDPHRYGETPSYLTGNPNLMLEFFDKTMLQRYIDEDIPIIACCRGLQTVVALYGGKLTQDLPFHSQSAHNTHIAHTLAFTEGYEYLEKQSRHTNSRHHQCADPNNLPQELEIIAFAEELQGKQAITDYSVPEVIIHREKNIFLYQGHLEDLPGENLGDFVFDLYLNGGKIKKQP